MTTETEKDTENIVEQNSEQNPVQDNAPRKEKVGKHVVFWILFAAIVATMVLYIVFNWADWLLEFNLNWLNPIIKSIFTIFIAMAVQRIIKMILKKITIKSQRSRTVTALLNSIIKYAIAIMTLFLILTYFLGENYMTELIAGLGVVALIIGLGCQQLISDVIAGVFMVFEGQVQVGDIVVIDGWRGAVTEIGLRTTIVEDAGGNLQIMNNSNIRKVINNSKSLSIAICDIGITYEESILRVEQIVKANMRKIKSQLTGVVDGPIYKGVQTLGDSAVVLRYVAMCKEEDLAQLQRDMNRVFKLIFDENNISIPYPQLTISQHISSNADQSDK